MIFAVCPCETCGCEATDDMTLNLVFSDHYHNPLTLEELGAVIREINRHSQDPMTRFWTFMTYVSRHHPSILAVELPAETQAQADAILQGCTLPQVTYGANSTRPAR
ncbi:MAG: hypothetical protein Q6K12_00875 [Gloeomargarita sp. DG_1_6_bins_138]